MSPQQRTSPLIILVLVALSGIPLILYATRQGPGISPDSITYLLTAENFSNGHGVSVKTLSGYQRVTHYAPLFPIAVSLVSKTGLSVVSAAGYLNAVLFVFNGFLVGWIAFKRLKSTLPFAVAALFLMLAAIPIVEIHAMIWSEPLMIFFELIGLFLILDYIERKQQFFLISSALALSLAFFTRYAASAFGVAAALTVLMLNRAPWKKKLIDCFILGSIALLPMFVWMGYVPGVSGQNAERHFIQIDDVNTALYTISLWLFPESLPGIFKRIGLVVAVFGTISLLYQFRKTKKEHTSFTVVLLFFVSYFAMWTYSISFARATIGAEPRILSPAYVLAILLILDLFQALIHRPQLKIAWIIFLLYIVTSYTTRTGLWIADAHDKGFGYNTPAWRNSKILQAAKDLPQETLIYSNSPQLLQFFAGHVALLLPLRHDGVRAIPREQYEREFGKMKDDLESNQGVIVYLYNTDLQAGMTTIGELKNSLPLVPIVKAEDGAVLRLSSQVR